MRVSLRIPAGPCIVAAHIMDRQQLIQTMQQMGVHSRKGMGQNFLYDDAVLTQIAAAGFPEPADHILEIGPGLGTLTGALMKLGTRVTVMELDPRFAQRLGDLYGQNPNFTLIQGDALQKLPAFLAENGPVKIIANIPYNISSPLVEIFCEHSDRLRLVVLTIQKEMAQRLCAKTRTKEYGALSVLVQLRFRTEYVADILRDKFFPSPAVDSAIARLTPQGPDAPRVRDMRRFRSLVRQGFTERRKMLKNRLAVPEGFDLAGALTAIGATPMARAEELSVGQWVELCKLLDG
ncbi:MAG: 16S rRNA (adenine(1518)-N(6)/adenine(1519)-N(6))-dimethyltransferase RsmA [Verrucomicrobiae bacterium]|nr:16S rRNA (adenine(1518)-N(6)/adenine(1519)-N(6))-dimethyltransferase RsmA [Verrucomicrobiae bacterium]